MNAATQVITILNFVRDTGKLLWELSTGHTGHVKDYNKNVNDLEAVAERLKSRANDFNISIQAAEMRGEIIKNEMQLWQKEFNKITTRKRELDGKMQNNNGKKCCFGGGPNLSSRYNLSKEAVKIKDSMDKLLQEKFPTVSHRGPPPRFKPPTGFEVFGSTDLAMEAVMKALCDDSINLFGLYGMGGVGKTYLIKNIAYQVEVDGLFDHVVLAVVSRTQSVKLIQGQIADKFDLKLEAESERGRANKLMERIQRCGRILVILDDVWDTLDLSEVGIPCRDTPPVGRSSSICKILLTSRSKHVCHLMNNQDVHIPLETLSESDAWKLFRSASGAGVVDRPDLNPVARKVAKECGGLPIALVVVGKSLGDKSLKDWKIALRRLAVAKPAIDDIDDKRLFNCIELSYDSLSDERGKQSFFLLCCLFPEDHSVEKEVLARYAMGLGLFQRVATMEEAREETHALITQLKVSCLLLDGYNERSIKMHDVVRDMAIRIASQSHGYIVKSGLGLNEWPNYNGFETCKAISLMSNDIQNLPDHVPQCPVIESLLLQDNREVEEITDSFFESMKTLKVLDLNDLSITSLPKSLSSLQNLRALCLDSCKSTDISRLGDLKVLEILSLRKSYVVEFPENIGNLGRLRILDLTLCSRIHIQPTVLPRLVCLEELYMQGSFAKWGPVDRGNEGETEVTFIELLSLTRLRILKVDVHDVKCIPQNINRHPDWENFDICINSWVFTRLMNAQLSKHETSSSRALVLEPAIQTLPNWFKEVVSKKAEKLMYRQSDTLCNTLVEYHKELTALKSLFIDQCAYVVHLMKTVDGMPNEPILRSLEELTVHQMYILEELCSGELPHGSLENLKFLEVQQCPCLLNVLVPSNLLQRIQNLETLHVSGNSVEALFGFDGLQDGQLRKLKEMKMENLSKLTSIWKGPNRIARFNNLKVVIVIQCEKLKNLFPVSTCICLSLLEELLVKDCAELEEIIQNDEQEVNLETRDDISPERKLSFPWLRSLSLQYLPRLTSFYAGGALECPKLKQQNVITSHCPQLELISGIPIVDQHVNPVN